VLDSDGDPFQQKRELDYEGLKRTFSSIREWAHLVPTGNHRKNLLLGLERTRSGDYETVKLAKDKALLSRHRFKFDQ